jgi:hypothetical protein
MIDFGRTAGGSPCATPCASTSSSTIAFCRTARRVASSVRLRDRANRSRSRTSGRAALHARLALDSADRASRRFCARRARYDGCPASHDDSFAPWRRAWQGGAVHEYCRSPRRASGRNQRRQKRQGRLRRTAAISRPPSAPERAARDKETGREADRYAQAGAKETEQDLSEGDRSNHGAIEGDVPSLRWREEGDGPPE